MLNIFSRFILIFCVFGLLACSSTESKKQAQDISNLFVDDAFNQVDELPRPEQLFALPSQVSNHVRRQFEKQKLLRTHQLPANEWLARYINASQGGFQYRDNYTRIASETYDDREGNCLSLVLLTAGLADALGVDVEFQEVDVPPVWDKQGQFYLINGHINLQLHQQDTTKSVNLRSRKVLIDFLPERDVRGYARREIKRNTVIAMFYNNVAAENLVEGDYDRAYAMLKYSLQFKPDFVPSLNNLAIIYRYKGLLDASEKTYRYALRVEPKELNTLYNFAVFLGAQNRLDEWAEVHRVLELNRINNPYYYYDIAQQAYVDKEYQQALVWYKRALEKADYRHEFYFGISRTYWATGDKPKAKKSMEKAMALTSDSSHKHRYQAKLHAMKSH